MSRSYDIERTDRGHDLQEAGEAVDVLLAALRKAERFVAGFEGCELQEGIDALLTDVRAAIAKAEGGQ